jgi:hypothetical protein
MAGNGVPGGTKVDALREMAAFDRLPPPVRQALNYAPLMVTAEACLTEIQFGAGTRKVVDEIRYACMDAGIDRADVDRCVPRLRLPRQE